mgnify:CR=1 FL=1
MRLPLEEIVIGRTLSVWLFGVFTAAVALVVSFLYQMVSQTFLGQYHKDRCSVFLRQKPKAPVLIILIHQTQVPWF